MLRNRIIISLLLITIVFLIAGGVTTANSKERLLDQELIVQEYELSNGEVVEVYTIDLLVSNAYVIVGDEGMVLVDAGMPLFSQVIENYLDKIGRDDLKLIYITHSHIDHFGSAAELRSRLEVPIGIHADDAATISEGNTKIGLIRNWYLFSEKTLPIVEPLLSVEPTVPDVIFYGGEMLDEYGIPNTEVIHVPGHTPGHSALVIDDSIAFVGDKVSAQGSDHIQKSYADDWGDLEESLFKLKDLEIDFYYAGHGENVISGEVFEELIN